MLVLSQAHAVNVQTFTIINHFDKPIRWIVSVNPDVLPGLQKEFTLAPFEQVKTEVIDLQKQAYLSGADGEGHTAFWAIGIQDNETDIHGYVSHGIAFSWTNRAITFCTISEYNQKNHC